MPNISGDVREYQTYGNRQREQALGLREELETAESDVSNLFAEIGQNTYIKTPKYIVSDQILFIYNVVYVPQRAQQFDILHKAVASATTQQEHHLKAMEEDMHLFVSSKIEVWCIHAQGLVVYEMVRY